MATGLVGRFQDSGIRSRESGFKIQDSGGFRIQEDSGFRAQDSKYRLWGLAWVALFITAMPFAFPHDTGLGHSRRTLLWETGPDGFVLEYRIRLPKDEVVLEMVKIDADGNGEISGREKDSFFRRKGRMLAAKFKISNATGKTLSAALKAYSLGHSFTQTFQYEITTGSNSLSFEDRNFRDKPGLVRILKTDTARVSLARPADLQHAEVIALRIVRNDTKNDAN